MRTRKPRAWMAIGLVIGCAAAAPSVADANPADVAVDGEGTAYFAFEHSDERGFRVQDRWIAPAGTLSDAQAVSGSDGYDGRGALDAGATGAVHVWVRYTDTGSLIQTRRRAPGGRLGPIQTLSPAGVAGDSPAVAVDAAGNAVYAWLQHTAAGDVVVRARRRTATGLLSAVQAVTTSGRAKAPQIDVDAGGDAVISWLREGANGREYLQARARAAGGTLSPAVQSISATTADVTSPSFAVAPDGRATFAWVARYSSGTIVHTRTRAADGTLAATQNLSPVVQLARATDTAVDADGNAVITWMQRSGDIGAVRARARSAGGTLGPLKPLSSAACNANEPQVATAADATSLLAWNCQGASTDTVQAVERHPGEVYGAVEDVVTSTSGYLNGPELALAPDGTAWLSWLRGDTTTSTLYREARSRKPSGELGDTLFLHSYLT